MIKKLLVLIFALSGYTTIYANPKNTPKRTFAIVVDKEVMSQNHAALKKYASSIEADGIKTVIIEDKWGVPDSIREHLWKLYKNQHLEGAVFVGDIPVPMVRDAQHLTTAFKMDQSRDWQESSVPSDRFYDDFDLKFDFIKKDSTNSAFFYYSLRADGAQTIQSDIYSGRIKPPHVEGRSKKEMLDFYFDKIVREKQRARVIKNLTYFGGHGYNSDCIVARIDERLSLTAQFNNLTNAKGNINYIDFTYDKSVKNRLMAELNREGLDLAILHHHGSDDTQFLNGTPFSNTPDQWIEMSQKFFRSKIRRAKDTTDTKKYYIDNYNIPANWVENAFNPKYITQDSLIEAGTDMYISDVRGIETKPPFIMLDACFNGSFHLEDYIAGHYIFNPGNTVVVKANSVNTLQDVWTNQLIGLLDLGVSVGNWAKEQFTLESHLIGDPTFHYQSSQKDVLKLNEHITHQRQNHALWKKYARHSNLEIQALAMKILFENKKTSLDELFLIQKSSDHPTVRLMAYNLINKSNNNLSEASIRAGLYDSYELIRRFASSDASKNQNPALLKDVVSIAFSPNITKRVDFQINKALDVFPGPLVLEAGQAELKDKNGVWYSEKQTRLERIQSRFERNEKEYKDLFDPNVAERSKRFTLIALRNSNHVANLNLLFKFMEESDNTDLKVTLAEAFSWFTGSWKKDEILGFCKERVNVEQDAFVKAELLRTINILSKS